MRLIDADSLKLGLCKECTLYPNKCLKENCDWDSIYHIEIEKTVEAIPVEWLENYIAKSMPRKEHYPYWYKRNYNNRLRMMIDDWRKENGNN